MFDRDLRRIASIEALPIWSGVSGSRDLEGNRSICEYISIGGDPIASDRA